MCVAVLRQISAVRPSQQPVTVYLQIGCAVARNRGERADLQRDMRRNLLRDVRGMNQPSIEDDRPKMTAALACDAGSRRGQVLLRVHCRSICSRQICRTYGSHPVPAKTSRPCGYRGRMAGNPGSDGRISGSIRSLSGGIPLPFQGSMAVFLKIHVRMAVFADERTGAVAVVSDLLDTMA